MRCLPSVVTYRLDDAAAVSESSYAQALAGVCLAAPAKTGELHEMMGLSVAFA